MYLALAKLYLICTSILLKHLFNETAFLFPADEGNKPSVSEARSMMNLTDGWTLRLFNDAVSTQGTTLRALKDETVTNGEQPVLAVACLKKKNQVCLEQLKKTTTNLKATGFHTKCVMRQLQNTNETSCLRKPFP